MLTQNTKNKKEEICEECFRIVCRKCGWIAKKEDIDQIQAQKLTTCPLCGWKPGDPV